MRRGTAGIAVASLVLALAVPRAGAQSEAVTLRLLWRQGEAVVYTLTRTLGQSMEIAGESRQGMQGRMEAQEFHRVLQIDPDGTMLVEIAYEDVRLSAGDRSEAGRDTPLVLKVRPDARVVEVVSGDERAEAFPFMLPAQPVGVGDSWTQRVDADQTNGAYTYTLARIDQAGAERVAVISMRIDARVAQSPDLGPLPAGMSVRSSRTAIRGGGEIAWSIDRGRLVRYASDTLVETWVDLDADGRPLQLRLTTKGTERRELRSADAVIPASVAPDLLIVPGRAVGAVTLDLPVAEITARYGPPVPETSAGYRGAGLRWSNGLSGYADAADPNRLLGLQISKPDYRTERHLGFGSTEGAVRLAYGSPQVLDVTIAGLGAMRFLIYDELGIAFAITRDRAHAALGPQHAPVGRVDWVTVFAPGTAGQVFQLP